MKPTNKTKTHLTLTLLAAFASLALPFGAKAQILTTTSSSTFSTATSTFTPVTAYSLPNLGPELGFLVGTGIPAGNISYNNNSGPTTYGPVTVSTTGSYTEGNNSYPNVTSTATDFISSTNIPQYITSFFSDGSTLTFTLPASTYGVSLEASLFVGTGSFTSYLSLTSSDSADDITDKAITVSPAGTFLGIYSADGSTITSFSLTTPSSESSGRLGVNDLVVAAPEPSTWAMMVGGLGLLLFVVRHRKHDEGEGKSARSGVSR